MLDIDLSNTSSSLLPSYFIKKITLEQNLGFIKGFDDPHVYVPRREVADRPPANSPPLVITVDSFYSLKKTKGEKRKSPAIKHIMEQSLKNAIVFWEVDDDVISSIEDSRYNLKYYKDMFIKMLNSFDTKIFEKADAQKEKQKENFSTDEYDVYNFTVKKEYAKQPKNLILLYGSYMDLPQGYIPSPGQGRFYSDINIEIIFKNGQALTESSVYVLPQTNQIWTGKVRLGDDNQTIVTVEDVPRILERNFIPNYKLEDNRIKSTVQKQILNFLDINNRLADIKMGNIEKPKESTRISDLLLSYSYDKKIAAFFNIDIEKMLKDNCLFYKIIDYDNANNGLKSLISSNSRIASFKVFRRRINKDGLGQNPLTIERSGVNADSRFGKEEVILESRDSEEGLLQTTPETLGNIFKEVKTPFNFNDRKFYFLDSSFANKSDGMYQYGIELEITDPTIKIIDQATSDIRQQITALKREEEKRIKMVSISTERILPEINDPHIEASEERMARVENLIPAQPSDMSRYVDLYMRYLNLFFDIQQSQATQISIILRSQVSAISENPVGITNFIKLLDDLIFTLENFCSKELLNFSNPHIQSSDNGYKRGSTDKRVFNIKKYFNNIFADANIKKSINVQYLPREGNQSQDTFAEFDVTSFLQFRADMVTANRASNAASGYLPYSINKEKFYYGIDSTSLEFAQKEAQYQKEIRKRLNSHVNIEISQRELISQTLANQLGNNTSVPGRFSDFSSIQDLREVEFGPLYTIQQERVLYSNTKINNFYEYCSQNFTKEKTFDEVVEQFTNNEEERRKMLAAVYYYKYFDGSRGAWVPIELFFQETNLSFVNNENTYLPCRFITVNNDIQSDKWITDNMKVIDSIFMIKIRNNQEAEELKRGTRLFQVAIAQ